MVCYVVVDLMKSEKGSCDVNIICIRLLVTIINYPLSIDVTKVYCSTRCLILLSLNIEKMKKKANVSIKV